MAVEFTIENNGAKDRPAPRSANVKKPVGRPANATAKKQTVEAALGTMNSLYGMLGMGALLLGRKQTAEYIGSQAEQWQAGNREAFEASDRLANLIANVGQTSGTFAFLATNGLAAFSISRAFIAESADIKAAREREKTGG